MDYQRRIRVGITGGAGYTGGELIRILLNHPGAEIAFVHSKSNAGNFLHTVHSDLLGETEMVFTDALKENIDVLFLCSGHGESRRFLEKNHIAENVKIIDLSNDFRLRETSTYAERSFVYGLPEINKKEITAAENIANPGCFATAVELALLPFAKYDCIESDVHVSGITGSTGAGQALSPTSHFSWRNGNVSAYKMLGHQHIPEVIQVLRSTQSAFKNDIFFIPYRGNFTRGIITTAYFKSKLSREKAMEVQKQFFAGKPFIHITDTNPALKQVVNSNKCILYTEKHGDTLVVISILDNLLKGASGQAVQNMNLMFGIEETVGLKLKTVNF
jgi:N-acetyl-gamma-glutamyl-phosphate reductase